MNSNKKSSNYDYFLKMDTAPYKGQWMAIAGKKVIAHGKTPKQVVKKSGTTNPSLLYLFKVPTKKELICLL